MKKLISTLATLAIAAHLASAAGTPEAQPAPGKSTPAAPTLELKNKSAFAVDESSRNPFWPIGFKPTAKSNSTTVEHVGPEISPTAFLVSSITVDSSGRYAIINGKVMTEGQVFGLQMGNQTYQITLKAIQDGQIVLARRDQEIIVPLRRR